MTFYFKPPRGDIPLHKMQECLCERIRYLQYVKRSDEISDCIENFKFEYLVDGSALDRTGHFMLRLLALKLNRLKDFLLVTESLLFEKRLKSLTFSQVKTELRTALRHSREILSSGYPLQKYKQFLENFTRLCDDLLSSKVLHHTFVKDHTDICNNFSLQAPFTFCLPLIATRSVELNAGLAVIPCGKLSQLLHCLFEEHMKLGMLQLAASNSYINAWDDDRVRYLLRFVRSQFDTYLPHASSNTHILAKEVDQKSLYFPPCMKNFHNTLRCRHRLSHYSRFYYSLFLKDIGMPVMESIEFWGQEYSQKNSDSASCSHSWHKDRKRYIYSIRHLYGLEGSRREYRSPQCQFLQTLSLGPLSEGGCPFVHFDDKNLINSLDNKVKVNELVTDSILSERTIGGATGACKMYFKALLRVTCPQSIVGDDTTTDSKSISFSSPSEFFCNYMNI